MLNADWVAGFSYAAVRTSRFSSVDKSMRVLSGVAVLRAAASFSRVLSSGGVGVNGFTAFGCGDVRFGGGGGVIGLHPPLPTLFFFLVWTVHLGPVCVG